MLNVAVLMGRLVADPELRHTANDISVTSFTLAVDRSYVKAGSDRQTDFIDIVAWRSTADFVCKYFRKGQLVAVQGSIQTRTYTGAARAPSAKRSKSLRTTSILPSQSVIPPLEAVTRQEIMAVATTRTIITPEWSRSQNSPLPLTQAAIRVILRRSPPTMICRSNSI